MKFTTATLFALAATVASATAVEKRIDVPGLKCSGEDALKCVAALSPTLISCITAAVMAGVDPLADAACFASGGNSIANLPDSCKSCF